MLNKTFCCWAAVVVGLSVVVAVANAQSDWSADMDRKRWYDYSKKKLDESLKRRLNGNLAKNVIMFLGDGLISFSLQLLSVTPQNWQIFIRLVSIYLFRYGSFHSDEWSNHGRSIE